MEIGYLGGGTWGFCLATLLAKKGHIVTLWSRSADFVHFLQRNKTHPKLPGYYASDNMFFTADLSEALDDVDMIVESVTSSGIRPVFREIAKLIDA